LSKSGIPILVFRFTAGRHFRLLLQFAIERPIRDAAALVALRARVAVALTCVARPRLLRLALVNVRKGVLARPFGRFLQRVLVQAFLVPLILFRS
jgi:hypothetical protein